MATTNVKCPYCGSENVIFFGYSRSGKRRCKCQNKECAHTTFQLEYTYKACKPGTSETIIKMAMNAAGTRDTARTLGISKDTVTRHLRKLKNFVENTNTGFLKNIAEGSQIDIVIENPLEMGEDNKKNGVM